MVLSRILNSGFLSPVALLEAALRDRRAQTGEGPIAPRFPVGTREKRVTARLALSELLAPRPTRDSGDDSSDTNSGYGSLLSASDRYIQWPPAADSRGSDLPSGRNSPTGTFGSLGGFPGLHNLRDVTDPVSRREVSPGEDLGDGQSVADFSSGGTDGHAGGGEICVRRRGVWCGHPRGRRR